MPKSVGEFLQAATDKLTEVGIASARLDSLILIEDLLERDRAYLIAHPETELSTEQANRLNKQVARRARHVPLAYIRGFTEFYGRRFLVNKYVLEPRPESETMINLLKDLYKSGQLQRLDGAQDGSEQRTKPYIKYGEGAAELTTQRFANRASRVAGSAGQQASSALTIADVGTGSGAIGITAALEIPGGQVDLYDIDSNCLAVAKHNSVLHELRLHTRKRDLLNRPLRHYDVILSNLPYVPKDWQINKAAMMEPRIAIFGGKDGLDLYRRMFSQLSRQHRPPKFVLTEALPPQHEELAKIAKTNNYALRASQDFIQVFALA
ncbi:MAG TPA: HemK/PrmC family methyltransferase [Candidatus Saccharimonadales bacterium]|nr:HemK/PrmC family methyltransferase [Candidatus Saccharimonadales bacterium]